MPPPASRWPTAPGAVPARTAAEAPRSDGIELISARQISNLRQGQNQAKLYSNPLGQACFQLNVSLVREQLAELKRHDLLGVGLAFVTEVRPVSESRNLSGRELRIFQAEVGCPPLVLTALACAWQLEGVRKELGLQGDGSRSEQERQLQTSAGLIVDLLIASGADADAADVGPAGHTALHHAAKGGALHLVSSLLRIGADCLARNNDGRSAEALAKAAGHTTCEQVLQVASMACLPSVDDLTQELDDVSAANVGTAQGRWPEARRASNDAKAATGGSDRRPAPEEDAINMRKDLVKLRREKARLLRRIHNTAIEQKERNKEVPATRSDVERATLSSGGQNDHWAQDLAKTGSNWEKQAYMLTRRVWDLQQASSSQGRQHVTQVERLQQQLRAAARRTKGLEPYLDRVHRVEAADAVLNRYACEARILDLARALREVKADLELSPELTAKLPELVLQDGEDGDAQLPPLALLLPALRLHRELQVIARERSAEYETLLEACNHKLAQKDGELEALLIKASGRHVLKGWQHLQERASVMQTQIVEARWM
mmetsp:Transcript_89155/g.255271  ORF Transcript_89155/g.255271 Transcript_89155/m.255271 type:complete len:547 (+) Transcript_89155:38-1678(+)